MPSALQFTEGHTSEYLYDAAGVKRKVKQVTTTGNLLVPMGSMLPVPADKVAVTTQTDYCGNVIYENGALSRIIVDGGYITMSGTTPTYHYYIQDHQGNNRVVFNQSGTIEQTNHYYPFGMTFGEGIDNSDNRYKYNDKELDRMHGLDLYDYGARMQNGMQFTTIDPLAEKYYSISPYVYCLNNPVRYIDPNGMWPTRKVVDNGRVGNRGFSLIPVMNPYHKIKRPHKGQDFPVLEGNSIHALAAGKISRIGYDEGGWGYYIDIKHSGGYLTRYAHLQKGGIKVKKGESIVDGEIIALSGMTGGATGPHLHLEMYLNGSPENPMLISNLQDQLSSQTEFDNKENPIELDEVVVTAKKLKSQNTLEQSIEKMDSSSLRPNENGNTGKYNQQGRSADQYYSDYFLKWYYSIK